MPRRAPLVIVTALVAALALASCTAAATEPPAETAASSPTPTSTPTDAGAADLDGALAERDQFFRDQQFAAGATTLVAVTPAQQEFIAQQRAYLESQGAVWSPEYETVYLALTADACETSILNGHALDATTFTTHLQTSPLVGTILRDVADDQRGPATANIASVMVFGTSHLCPADAPQWESAYAAVFG